MLTPGNKKLGGHLIWGFGLPSGTVKLCPGMTATCKKVCYAVRLQSYRPQAAKRYRQNLRFAKRKDFVRRVRAFLISQGIRVVRIHTGGEFLCGAPHKNSYVANSVMWRKSLLPHDSFFVTHQLFEVRLAL